MDAKGHCKLRYGDGGDDEDADLDEFYDYSSRFNINYIVIPKFNLYISLGNNSQLQVDCNYLLKCVNLC